MMFNVLFYLSAHGCIYFGIVLNVFAKTMWKADEWE